MKKNFKFVFSILMLVAIVFGMSLFEKKQVFAQEDSATTMVSSEGISISNANDLLRFFEGSENGYLTNDIDLAGKFWIPKTLNGKTLNGKGYSILNMTINESISGNAGFLSDFSSGKIVNIQFKNSYISSYVDNVGVVAGKLSGSAEMLGVNIENASLKTSSFAGGLVGIYEGGRIENCRVSNALIDGVGGAFVGNFQASGSNIRNSYALDCLLNAKVLTSLCGNGNFIATSCFVLNGESFNKSSVKASSWTNRDESGYKSYLGEENFYNSWVYSNDLGYPVLRGIGNTIFALKSTANSNSTLGQDFNIEDFSKEENNGNETLQFIDSNNSVEYILDIKDENTTWKQYGIYRIAAVGIFDEIVKDVVSNSDFVSHVEVKNQIENSIFVGRQNYFVLQFSQTPRYQETNISVYSYPNLQKLEKTGLRIKIYVEEGSAYVGDLIAYDKRITADKIYSGSGVKLENQIWYSYSTFDTQSTEEFFRYIYLIKGTRLYFSVEFPENLDFYHSMRIANVNNNEINVLSEQTYKTNGYIVADNQNALEKDLRLCFTDFYPVIINSSQWGRNINPIIEWDGEDISKMHEKTISKTPANIVGIANLELGGEGYKTASYGYVSYATGEYYFGRNNSTLIPNIVENLISTNYPVYNAQGFEFSGYRAFFNENNLTNSLNGEILSSTAEYYFSTTTYQSGGSAPNISDKARDMLTKFLTQDTSNEKLLGYKTYDFEKTENKAIMLFATWRKKINNNLTFKNTLYTGNSSDIDWMTNFDTQPNYSLSLLNNLGSFELSYKNLKSSTSYRNVSSSIVINNIPTMTPNDEQIKLQLTKLGAGLTFKGIVITSENGNIYAWMDNFYSATYLSSQNPTSFNASIYNICGDIVVYAVFERTASFNVLFDISKDSPNGSGYNFSYGVYDYNGNFVASTYQLENGSTGTISNENEAKTKMVYSPLTINNLKAGYEIRVYNMSSSKPGFSFSKDGILRFNSIYATALDQIDPIINYDSIEKSWSFINLINASIKKHEDSITYDSVQVYVDMEEISSTIEVVLGFEQNLTLFPISEKEDYEKNATFYPNLTLQKLSNSSSVLSKQDNTKYTISSMGIADEYLISILNQKYYTLIKNNSFVLYKFDAENNSWVFEANNNIDKFLVEKVNEDFKFTISEFLGAGTYRLYIILERQEYEFNFSSFENGEVKYLIAEEDAINIPDEDFINEVKSGGSIKLSFVDICFLYFSPNAGYYIKTLIINGIKYINEGIASSGSLTYGEGYKITLSYLDQGLFNNTNNAHIEIEFAPRTDVAFIIAIHKENLNGNYEFYEQISDVGIANNVITLDELIELYNNKYVGFEIDVDKSTQELKIIYGNENVYDLFYKRINYEIVLISDDDEQESLFVKFEHEIVLPQCEAIKEGYEFSGNWMSEGGTMFEANKGFVVSEGLLLSEFNGKRLILMAFWTPKQYTIIWDGNLASNSFEQWGNYNSNFYKIKNIDGTNYLTSKVTYGEKIIGGNLPLKPERIGFEFAGWLFDDNSKIDFSQNYIYPRDMTVKAAWSESAIGIQFDSQYSFINLSYSLKAVSVGGTIGDAGLEGYNFGLPTLNCEPYGLNFMGFYTETSSGIRVLETTPVKELLNFADGDGVIVLYAQYSVAAPILQNGFEKVKTVEYNENDIKFFNISPLDFSNNQAGILNYSYKWFKAGSTEVIATSNYLSLKNVLDSGKYSCSIVAEHQVWGKSFEALFDFDVNITPKQINFELENSKVFDFSTAVLGAKSNQHFDVLTSNMSPKFDSYLVGKRKILASYRYNGEDSLIDVKSNFVPLFNNTKIDNFSFAQNGDDIILTIEIDGEIQCAEFEVDVNAKGYYTSKPHEIMLQDFLSENFKNFLGKNDLTITGKIKTISGEIKTYYAFNNELNVEFEITDNKGEDLSFNFICTLTGEYEILSADELKTLYISKVGTLNIENSLNTEIFTPKFKLVCVFDDGEVEDISSSGEYNFGSAYIQVINENNSSFVQVIVNNAFSGEIRIIANAFVYNIGSQNTTAALLEWKKGGTKLDVGADKTLVYKFGEEKIENIQAVFRNYAIINFDFLLGGEKQILKVYNTGEDLTLLNLPNGFEGLSLIGWYKDKNYSNEFIGKEFKSIEELTLFAKYELLELELNVLLNNKNFENAFSKTYNAISELLELNVVNSCDYIFYSIEIFKNGQIFKTLTNSSLQLALKNVEDSGLYKFIISAKIPSLNLAKTKEISRNIEILKKEYTISQEINKVYDSDSKLKQNGNDYIIVSVILDDYTTEEFRLVGNYNSSKVDASEIIVSSILSTENSNVNNYNFHFNLHGMITPKSIVIDIGSFSQNIKAYDGEIFEKTFDGSFASTLVENETLLLNVATSKSDVGQYSFEDSTLEYTCQIKNQLGEEVDSCYEVSYVGGMEISKKIFSTQGLTFSDVEIVYDSQPHIIMLNGTENLPFGIKIEYSFQINNEIQNVVYENDILSVAPVEVGTYTIIANVISDGNYSLSGETQFSATLNIIKRKISLIFGEMQFENVGIKTLEIDSRTDSFDIVNLPLVPSHYLIGTLQTNDEKVGLYSSDNLIKKLKIFDEHNFDVSENYEIICHGSIEIIQYYFIVFDKNSEDATGSMPKMQINYGTTAILYSNNFKREGYNFVEWNINKDGSGKSYPNLSEVLNLSNLHKQEVVLHAIWAPSKSKLTVEYYTQNYNQTTYTKVKTDEYFEDDSIKTGYVVNYEPNSRKIIIYNSSVVEKEILDNNNFVGFAFDSTKNEFFNAEIMPNGAILRIYFKRLSYTLKFIPNNNQNTYTQTVQFGHNFKLTDTIPVSPSYQGYHFEGWYLNYLAEEREKIDWNNFVIDEMVIPKYLSVDNEGNVIVDQDGNQVIILWANYIVASNTPFSVEIYKEELDGTYELFKTDDFTTATDNYIELNKNQNALYVYESVITRDDEGKIIEYGYDDDKFIVINLTNYAGFSIVDMPQSVHFGFAHSEEKLIIKIYFARNLYKITFDYNNETPNLNLTKKFGYELQSPTNPIKQGYSFVGWFENENLTSFPLIVYKDLNLVAKWEPATTDFTLTVFLQALDLSFEKQEYQLSSITNYIGKVLFDTNNENAKFIVEFYNKEEKVDSFGIFEFKGFEVFDDYESNIFECEVFADGTGKLEVYLFRKQYSLTFVSNGGEEIQSQSYKFEQEAYPPTEPTKQDYVFGGWCSDETLQNLVTWPLKIVKDTTLYAKWNSSKDISWQIEFYKEMLDGTFNVEPTIERFTGTTGNFISIENNSNNWIISVYQDSSKQILLSTLKTIDIEGYSIDETLGVLNGSVGSNLILKVYLKLNEYDFIVHYNNGSSDKSTKYKYSQKVQTEVSPTKIGYNFNGWFQDQSFETPFDFENFTMPANSVEIFAKYMPALVDYKINYFIYKYNNEIQNIELTPTLERTILNQSFTNTFLAIENGILNIYDSASKDNLIQSLSLDTPIGYEYYESEENVLECLVLADSSSSLSIYFSPRTFEVTFNLNGGTIEGETKKEFIFGQKIFLPKPTRPGFEFAGWFYDASQSSRVSGDEQNDGMYVIFGASNFDIYAGWRAKLDTKYKVEYYVQNIDDDNYTIEDSQILTGQTGTLVNANVINKVGFYVDEDLTDESGNRLQVLSAIIAGDNSTVLRVYYTRNIYKITFVPNGGTGEEQVQSFKYEQAKQLDSNSFTRKNFNFVGWAENPNSHVVFNNNQTFVYNKNIDIKLYAMWSLDELDEVIISSNVLSNSIYYGDTITLKAKFELLGDYEIEYTWLKGTAEISKEDSITLQEISESGEYSCRVTIISNEIVGVVSNQTTKLSNTIKIQIDKRPINVKFEQKDFVFDGIYKTIAYSLEFEFDDMHLPSRTDIDTPATQILYSVDGKIISYNEVKDVAKYFVQVTTADNNFELVNNELYFEITPCPFDITSQIINGMFYKYFEATDPILSSKFITPVGEEIEILFERELGEEVGFYDLINPSTNNLNYKVSLGSNNNGFEIKKIGATILRLSLNKDLLSKVYDGQNISLNLPAFDIANIQTSVSATIKEISFVINKNSKDVGRYEIALKSCITNEFQNVELDQTYYFTITPKSLTLSPGQKFEKVYDQTTSISVLADGIIAGDLVAVKANTTSSNVANNLAVETLLVGLDAKNYNLDSSFKEIKANILPRNVKIIAEEQQVVYGELTKDYNIKFEIFGESDGEFVLEVDSTQFVGALVVENAVKYIVGSYKIELGTLACNTSNYNILELEDAYITVVEREISVDASFNKFYDGTTDFVGEYSFNNAIEGDNIILQAKYDSSEVGDRILTLSLQGLDANNYLLSPNTAFGVIEYEFVNVNLNYCFEDLQTEEHSQISISTLNLIRNKTIKESGYNSLPQPFASGWEFEGWYTKQVGGDKWDIDTFISYENCPTNTLTLYAHWTQGNVKITVGIITVSSTNYVIETMDKTQVASGYFYIDSQSYYEVGNEKYIKFGNTCVIKAVANQGFEFQGFYSSLSQDAEKLESNEEIKISGDTISILMKNNISIYIRFKVQQKTIVLDVNADDDVKLNGGFINWESEKHATGNLKSFSASFDLNTQINLPSSNNLTRQGYTLLGWSENKDEQSFVYTDDYVVSSNITLYAIWSTNAFIATFIANTGEEDPSLLNSDVGRFENPTNISNPGVLEVPMQYGQLFGNIQVPMRKGFEFVGWYDNPQFQGEVYTQNSKFEYNENQVFYAKWQQKKITIKISYNFNRGTVNVKKALNVDVTTQKINDTIVLTINTNSLDLLAFDLISNSGYNFKCEFDKVEGLDFILNKNLTTYELSRFVEEINIIVTFTSKLHEITLKPSQNNLATIKVSLQNVLENNLRDEYRDDNNIITILPNGEIIVKLFTEERILVENAIILGYYLQNVELQNTDTGIIEIKDNNFEFYGFNENCVLKIIFVPVENEIIIKAGFDNSKDELNLNLGSVELIITEQDGSQTKHEGAGELRFLAKTNSTLTLKITPNQGFVLSTKNWNVKKDSNQGSDWNFDFSRFNENIVVISGFNTGGELAIPFERLLHSLTVKIALYDNEAFEILENCDAVSYEISPSFVQNNEFYFKEQIALTAKISENNYEFLGWAEELNIQSLISDALYSFVIEENTIIYLVVRYSICKINYISEGGGEVLPNNVEVKFGQNSKSVKAVPHLGYHFEKWQKFEDGVWVDDSFLPERSETAVTTNMTFKAIFLPNEININISSKLILYYDSNSQPVYEENDISSFVGTIYNFNKNQKVINTSTGEKINLSAYSMTGYHLVGWEISNGSEVSLVQSPDIYNIIIQNFTQDFVLTAIFETDECEFEIYFAQQSDYNSVFAGIISVNPEAYLSSANNNSKVFAKARVGQSFDITAKLENGYDFVSNESKILVGFKAENEEMIYIEDVEFSILQGLFKKQLKLTLNNFAKGGKVYIFVSLTKYPVIFHLTAEQNKEFELTINSTFNNVDPDYLFPTRVGYNFKGWYSDIDGNGLQYINDRGVVQTTWNVEHNNLYAHWERAYVRYNISYEPGMQALNGDLDWIKDTTSILHYAVMNTVIEYYVGNDVYFEAPLAADNYKFSHFELDGTKVCTSRKYNFYIPEDETNFEQNIKIVYAVKISVGSSLGGGANIDGENYVFLTEGETAILTAFANTGYEFVGWIDNVHQGIISNQNNFEVGYSSQPIQYTPVFQGVKVEIIISTVENGKISSWKINGKEPILENGKYYARYLDSLSFEVESAPGYWLSNWTINGNDSSPFERYIVSLNDVDNGRIIFTPVFNLANIGYTVNFNQNEGMVKQNGSKISSGATYYTNYLQSILLEISSNMRYRFYNIKLNGVVIEEDLKDGQITIFAKDFDISKRNIISIEFEKLYWLELMEEFEGDGTINNPYLIYTAKQFAMMCYLINNNIDAPQGKQNYANGYYVLSNSVNFDERFWIPIGTEENPFAGTIKFNYRTSNIHLDKDYSVIHYDGLFGYITEDAQFIDNFGNYKLAIIAVSSFVGLLVIITVVYIIYKHVKKKKLEERQSTLNLK